MHDLLHVPNSENTLAIPSLQAKLDCMNQFVRLEGSANQPRWGGGPNQ